MFFADKCSLFEMWKHANLNKFWDGSSGGDGSPGGGGHGRMITGVVRLVRPAVAPHLPPFTLLSHLQTPQPCSPCTKPLFYIPATWLHDCNLAWLSRLEKHSPSSPGRNLAFDVNNVTPVPPVGTRLNRPAPDQK